MSPMNHVGKRLLPPIFLPNIGHNQSTSRMIALTFLTKKQQISVINKSAFFVQRAHPYRAFLRNHSKPSFRVPIALTVPTSLRVPSALTIPTCPRVPSALTVPRVPTVPSSLILFLLLRLPLLLLLLCCQESHYIGSHNQRTVKVDIYTDSLI